MKVNHEWINISDMMSGLMMVFLFIAIAFMVEVKEEQEVVRKIAVAYRESQLSLNHDLHKEFEKDLVKWGAEITEDNIFRFNSPEVLFNSGSSVVSKKFKDILDDFFPRYVAVLTSNKYINEIDEIRIEGHTSNIWNNVKTKNYIYLNNMNLSQERASNVLTYCYSMTNTNVLNHKKWLEEKFRANGMAFSKLIMKDADKIDYAKSRRVEFKVLTNVKDKIYTIIEKLD